MCVPTSSALRYKVAASRWRLCSEALAANMLSTHIDASTEKAAVQILHRMTRESLVNEPTP